MVSKDVLVEQFSMLGWNINDISISKCIELCSAYKLTEEELVEAWTAFSLTALSGAQPTVEMLNQMERKDLAKKGSLSPHSKLKGKSLTVYNVASTEKSDRDEILQLYSTTPKAKHRDDTTNQSTPDNPTKRLAAHGRSPRAVFSPASFSPKVATPSAKYETRTNSGDVVFGFGNCDYATWHSQLRHSVSITLFEDEEERKFIKKYMHDHLQIKADVLDGMIEDLGQLILHAHSLPEPANPTERHAEPFIAVGRVCCDANGHLNPTSVVLESAQDISCGRSIALDVSKLDKYSLFPGQIIAVEGVNFGANKITVDKLYTDTVPKSPMTLPSSVKGPIQVVVVAGPYTQSDTLLYQPVEDLIAYIEKHEPNVAILIGPFVDSKHPHVEEGTLAETFDALFEKIIDGIMQPLKGSHTQVVVIPSWRDVHHHTVFPTPPFVLKKKHPNLHLMPDPCRFRVGEVTFGVTSVDILFHLGKEEISFPSQGSDRLGRLTNHVLEQRSFYPLFPPAEELSVDLGHLEIFSQMPSLPHILILPSDLRYFIKEIKGCIVVNPERLAKGLVGGTMARIEVGVPEDNMPLHKCVAAQILKI